MRGIFKICLIVLIVLPIAIACFSDANMVYDLNSPWIPQGFKFMKRKSFSCGGQTHTVNIYRHVKTGLDFVLVPGGTFVMGSNDELGTPLHSVTVKSFLICRTEVTQGVWKRIMNTQPWHGKEYTKEGPDYAASYINLTDAETFCRKTGLRLPSEAEWEYACKAGTVSRFSFGDSESDLGSYGWYIENTVKRGQGYPHQVGRKKPNAFGLYDMLGNVSEICQDWYVDDYLGTPTDGSAYNSVDAGVKVYRGGDFGEEANMCGSAHRFTYWPDYRCCGLGFRPACSLKE